MICGHLWWSAVFRQTAGNLCDWRRAANITSKSTAHTVRYPRFVRVRSKPFTACCVDLFHRKLELLLALFFSHRRDPGTFWLPCTCTAVLWWTAASARRQCITVIHRDCWYSLSKTKTSYFSSSTSSLTVLDPRLPCIINHSFLQLFLSAAALIAL